MSCPGTPREERPAHIWRSASDRQAPDALAARRSECTRSSRSQPDSLRCAVDQATIDRIFAGDDPWRTSMGPVDLPSSTACTSQILRPRLHQHEPYLADTGIVVLAACCGNGLERFRSQDRAGRRRNKVFEILRRTTLLAVLPSHRTDRHRGVRASLSLHSPQGCVRGGEPYLRSGSQTPPQEFWDARSP